MLIHLNEEEVTSLRVGLSLLLKNESGDITQAIRKERFYTNLTKAKWDRICTAITIYLRLGGSVGDKYVKRAGQAIADLPWKEGESPTEKQLDLISKIVVSQTDTSI